MVFLIEFPDINTFYIDVPVTTSPLFVARSTILPSESLVYIIKWWYVNNPNLVYSQSGQSITFDSPSSDIDFYCEIYENTTIYKTNELLGFYFHLKVLPSDINYYYRGDHESLQYDGYVNYNNFTGILHKNEFKNDGVSGYSGYSGVYLPVLNIIDSENVRLQKGYNDALLDENLNPIYDDEDDSFSIFEKYNLDPTDYSNQETFNKLQKFEQENFTLYNKKSSMMRILKPIDDQMVKLYNRISELEKQIEVKIIDYFIAGEDIEQHQLITLIDTIEGEENLTKVFKANAFTIIEDEVTTIVRRCYGIALDDVDEGEICEFQISGRIEDFNFWWDENFDFEDTVNEIYFLWEYGKMNNVIPDPDNISFEDVKYNAPVIYQEVGFPLSENEFMVNIKQPILRNLLEDCDESGSGEPEEPI